MKLVDDEASEAPLYTGKWKWIPDPAPYANPAEGGFKISLNGYTATQHAPNSGHHKGLWEITAPEERPQAREEGSYTRFRSAPWTALRRFAHVVQTGCFYDLTMETRGVPEPVDKLWHALMDRFQESERLVRDSRVGGGHIATGNP